MVTFIYFILFLFKIFLVPVLWSRADQIAIDCNDDDYLKLQCLASGFPRPQYQWLEEDKPLECATLSSLTILRFNFFNFQNKIRFENNYLKFYKQFVKILIFF